MIGVFTFVLAITTPEPVMQLTARASDGTMATIAYWLMPSPRKGEEAVGPIIGGGTLRIISHTHSLSIPLSRLGMVSEGAKWTQFVTTPGYACYAQPLSINRARNGHVEVTIRYAWVGKGCYPWTTVIDAVTGKVISSQ